MNRMIAWFAGHGVAANLLMVFIVVAGLTAIVGVRQEVMPEISVDIAIVRVPYPGAAPEEVETGVVVRVEEAIQDLVGIKRIRSTAAENMGTVLVEIEDHADIRKLVGDIKSRVDAIDTFPDEAEEPIIEEAVVRKQVLEVAISGQAEEATLKAIGERVREDLVALPAITQVDLASTRPYEISIEVSEAALRQYGLSFHDVAAAVRRSSLDLPGGKVSTEGGEILLRTEAQAYRGREFADLPLRTLDDGTRLMVGDVATVVDGFADTDRWSRFDSDPAVVVQVFRVGEQSALEVANQVGEYLERTRPRMPEGIELTVWHDQTRILRSRLDLLMRNGRNGFLLVVLVLALFLKLRLAAWVSIGIPISFLGAFALLPYLDVSVNLLSLFAFIVVLGIVVDDAIIVGENIYTRYQNGEEGLRAAVLGAQDVAKPVVFAVLTSIAAFAPLLFVTGAMGKMMRNIPLVVIPTLAFSLVESLLILPRHLSHLRHARGDRSRGPGPWQRIQARVAQGLRFAIYRTYQPTLRFALDWRYLTVAGMLALMLITVGVVRAGWIRFNFMPDVEADNSAAYLTMPQGTPATVTEEALRTIESAAQELGRELEEELGEQPIVHVMTTVGDQPFRNAAGPAALNVAAEVSSGHLGEVNLELTPAEERSISSGEITNRWRQKVGAVADAVELTYSASLFGGGEDINIELTGPDIEQLQEFAASLKESLRSYPGVRDISDSYRAGKRELELRIRPEAEAAGLTQADLARQVRQAFYGEEAQRIQRGRDDVKVMVRFPEDQRRSLGDVENLRIRTPGGVEVPFSTAAEVTMARGPASIARTDRRRVVNVMADVDDEEGNTTEILADLRADVLPRMLADYPDIRYSLEGQQQEQRETMSGLMRGFAIALLMIFALLAIPFGSYSQPMIVMSAIPFGFVGAIWGHMLMGYDLAIISVFGIVALTGVVVNDSLVLVDFINRSYAGGLPVKDAIAAGGAARFRPILLTSLTTFAGLTPLLLEKSLQAKFLVPMAISLGFGVLFATFITLILVPCLYLILEDLRSLPRRLAGRSRVAESTAPADSPG